MTEWHVRYQGRGVMIYWHMERQATCIYSQLKRCSSSEVSAMIEGVLRHCTDMDIQRHYVDSHGQSEVAFAFCHLLGFELTPRLSKVEDQDTAPQIEALEAAGCQRVYEERISGGRWDRPELHRLLDRLAPGDVLTVWKLDRLSRSLKDLLLILDKVEKAGAGFRSLTENIDSTKAPGRMMMQILGAFAEFERAMVRKRTQAGLRSARAQGRYGGRRPKLSPQQQVEVLAMLNAGRSAADVARLFRVHRATISRVVSSAKL